MSVSIVTFYFLPQTSVLLAYYFYEIEWMDGKAVIKAKLFYSC